MGVLSAPLQGHLSVTPLLDMKFDCCESDVKLLLYNFSFCVSQANTVKEKKKILSEKIHTFLPVGILFAL